MNPTRRRFANNLANQGDPKTAPRANINQHKILLDKMVSSCLVIFARSHFYIIIFAGTVLATGITIVSEIATYKNILAQQKKRPKSIMLAKITLHAAASVFFNKPDKISFTNHVGQFQGTTGLLYELLIDLKTRSIH